MTLTVDTAKPAGFCSLRAFCASILSHDTMYINVRYLTVLFVVFTNLLCYHVHAVKTFIFLKYNGHGVRFMSRGESEVVKIGREEKLKQLMDDYGKLVFSICYRLVSDYFTAEDLTQDTFLSAFTSLDRFDGQNEKAWLTRIATNKCLDHLKSASQRTAPCETEELDFRAGASPLLEDEYIEKQLSADVRKACEELREPYRSVAVQYFCEDRPLSQIAHDTGEPLKTVQTRAYRAKKMLRENLREVIPL